MVDTRKKDSQEQSEGFVDGLKSYFKGVRSEWGKITWPERNQVFYETLVVIGVVFFFTALVFIIDMIFIGLLGLVPSR